ncbi:MAG: hypothetical protein KJO34_03385, partial [Deltaproteobacteria bacterium]|nr:hypothetical protein [Deltaproteobacteria bacterium]
RRRFLDPELPVNRIDNSGWNLSGKAQSDNSTRKRPERNAFVILIGHIPSLPGNHYFLLNNLFPNKNRSDNR